MIKLWDNPANQVYRLYLQGWTKTGGWSAAVDVVAFDELEARDRIMDHDIYGGNTIGLPEAEFWSVEASRTAWWIKAWLKKESDPSWRFELRDTKEW